MLRSNPRSYILDRINFQMMEFLFIAILLTITDAEESQLEGPKNELSVVGSNVALKCSPPSRDCNGIEWLKFGVSGSVFNDLGIISGAYRDRYSVDNSSGCDLVIRNVEHTDAGRFICRAIISSNTVDGTAYLIILKNHSTCAINASLGDTLERDGVHLICEVTYHGTNTASMVWEGVADAPDAVKIGNTLRRSHLVAASAPEVPSFTCNTSFVIETKDSDGRLIVGLATNMPVTTCKTSVIKVKYSARDVTLSPSLSNYPPGSSITCTAKGHPSPTFKWQKLENGGTWMDIHNMNGSKFTVKDTIPKQYRCVAMNVVRGRSYNATSHELRVNNTDDNGNVTDTTAPLPFTLIVLIGAGVGVGFLLPLIFLHVVCFCARCCPGYRCCHSEKKSNDNAAQHNIDHEMKSSPSHHPSPTNSSIPRTKSPLVEELEAAHERLREVRDEKNNTSLEERQKARPKEKRMP